MKLISFFALALLAVPILGCPTCVGRVNTASHPFFTSDFDDAKSCEKPAIIFQVSQDEGESHEDQ